MGGLRQPFASTNAFGSQGHTHSHTRVPQVHHVYQIWWLHKCQNLIHPVAPFPSAECLKSNRFQSDPKSRPRKFSPNPSWVTLNTIKWTYRYGNGNENVWSAVNLLVVETCLQSAKRFIEFCLSVRDETARRTGVMYWRVVEALIDDARDVFKCRLLPTTSSVAVLYADMPTCRRHRRDRLEERVPSMASPAIGRRDRCPTRPRSK